MPLVQNWDPVRVACGSTSPTETEQGVLAMATININGTLTLERTGRTERKKFTSFMVPVVEVMLFGTRSASFAQGQWVAEDAVRFVDRLNRGKNSWIRRVAKDLRKISLLACLSIMLAVVNAGTATAHHQPGHTKGGGGTQGSNGGDSGNDGQESYVADIPVLMGDMLVVEAEEATSVSSKSKPAISNLELIVKKSKNSETRTFLKFNVGFISGQVLYAKVLLRSTRSSGYGGELREAGVWPGGTIAWDNKPTIINFEQSALSEVGRVASNTYYEWDVLSIVNGDGNEDRVYSFALTCDSCSSRYESDEASMVPYLVIVVEDVPSVAPSVVLGESGDPVLVGAGDIARCGTTVPSGDQQTADLVSDILLEGYGSDVVFTAGDGAYPNGAYEDYINCYDPSWGQLPWNKIKPSPGNHDYYTTNAQGYFEYFGDSAVDQIDGLFDGYYSYNIPPCSGEGEVAGCPESWHVVSLNSNCSWIGGCNDGSPQNTWLQADLAAARKAGAECIVAYLHHTPLSSGPHGSDLTTQPLMAALYKFRADILIAAHDHTYERFMPQDANGVPDLAYGVRLFVVGTGGASLYSFQTPVANSEARFNYLNGVLMLTLHPTSYDWEFIPVEGTFSDVGSASCHDPLPGDPS